MDRRNQQARKDGRTLRHTDTSKVLIETTTDGFVALDATGRVTYLNTASVRVSGQALSKATGQTCTQICPELQGTLFEEEISAALRAHANADFEYLHEPIGKWFRVRATPTRGGGLAIFFHDITEQKEAEFEKRTCHQRSFEILESVGDAFFALDHEDRFSYVNRHAEKLLGRPRDELLGKVIWNVFPDLVGTDLCGRLQRGTHERARFVSSALSGGRMEIDVYPCAGGVCVYMRDATSAAEKEPSVQERIFSAQEAERQRIARELHDSPGQVLAAIAMGLRAILDARSLAEAKQRASQIQTLTHRLTNELDSMTRALHTAGLGRNSLGSALRRLCADFAETFGMDVRLVGHAADATKIGKSVQLTAYRIVQEALANVARHSRAAHVRVGVRISPHTLHVKVVDDGRGFTPAADLSAGTAGHMGLQSMRERAELLGGTVTVQSTPGRGTCVRATIPRP